MDKWVYKHLKPVDSQEVLPRGSGTHRVCTVRLFYLDNLPDTIVLFVSAL